MKKISEYLTDEHEIKCFSGQKVKNPTLIYEDTSYNILIYTCDKIKGQGNPIGKCAWRSFDINGKRYQAIFVFIKRNLSEREMLDVFFHEMIHLTANLFRGNYAFGDVDKEEMFAAIYGRTTANIFLKVIDKLKNHV